MMTYRYIKKFIILSFVCTFSVQTYAAGPYVYQQSVSAMGNSFAGAGAAGDDASIGFYNPAGLMLIEEAQVVGSLMYISSDIELELDSATDSFGQPIPGVAGEEIYPVESTPSGALHGAVPITEDLVLGMSLTAPYGGVVDYSDTVISDAGNQVNLVGYDMNLSLAYQLTEKLSLGAGANAQYLDVKFNVHFASVASGSLEDVLIAEYKGDDFALYPNIGLLYEFTEKTRMGLAYRFPVTHDTEGTFEGTLVPEVGAIPVIDTAVSIPFAGVASLSFFHELTPKIELLADVTYEDWSRVGTIIFDLGTQDPNFPSEAPAVVNFKDTWRVGAGLNYLLNETIKFRSGIAYNQSPVQDEYRLTLTPDSDNVEISLGMGIAPKSWEKTRIDIAYMHVFFADAPINEGTLLSLPPFSTGHVVGDFNSALDFIGIQFVQMM